jgi:ABC-type branched-subunit amino acid transport system permease subunit
MDYLLHVATVISLYAGLIVSLNLLLGHAGIFSFAHASFFGIGSYMFAMLTAYAGWDWWLAACAAMAFTGIIAALIGIPTLRLGGDYFILALFGFQLIVVNVILNLDDITNGPFGIRGIPRPAFGDYTLKSGWPFLIGSILLTAAIFFIARSIVTSPLGARLHAVRDDETVAASLGINIAGTKVMIFVVAACLAAAVGVMNASYFRFVEANAFNAEMMILLLAMAFVGGTRSLWGAIVGPVILVLFPEIFRFMGFSGVDIGKTQQALYGLLLVLVMLFRPQGIVRPREKATPK